MPSKIIRSTFIVLVSILFISILAGSVFAGTINYIYDELNRLKEVDYPDGTIIKYTYDKLGNIKTREMAGTSHTLSILKTGTGTGSITSSPAGIQCGPTCASTFDDESVVTLTSTPDPGMDFVGWSGGGCSGTSACQITMSFSTAVTATFNMIPPVADFSCTPTSAGVPFTVTCTDTSTHNPSSWQWDFGDGTTSNLRNPSHTYFSVASFAVALTASNAGGSNTKTKTNYISATQCSNPVRIAGSTPTYYSTLQAAYNAAPNGAVIQMLDWTYSQSLNLNRNISVTLEGGKLCDYSATVGTTTLQGSITTSLGTLTIKDIILTP